MITGGFGTTIDLQRGTARRWYMRGDRVKRWADNDQCCDCNGDGYLMSLDSERAGPLGHRLDGAVRALCPSRDVCLRSYKIVVDVI